MKTFTIAKPISISIDNFYIQVLPFILFFIKFFTFKNMLDFLEKIMQKNKIAFSATSFSNCNKLCNTIFLFKSICSTTSCLSL